MNVALLILLAGYDVNSVITEVGYEVDKQVAPNMGSSVIVEEHLYRPSGKFLRK